eukprot:gene18812-25357_t
MWRGRVAISSCLELAGGEVGRAEARSGARSGERERRALARGERLRGGLRHLPPYLPHMANDSVQDSNFQQHWRPKRKSEDTRWWYRSGIFHHATGIADERFRNIKIEMQRLRETARTQGSNGGAAAAPAGQGTYPNVPCRSRTANVADLTSRRPPYDLTSMKLPHEAPSSLIGEDLLVQWDVIFADRQEGQIQRLGHKFISSENVKLPYHKYGNTPTIFSVRRPILWTDLVSLDGTPATGMTGNQVRGESATMRTAWDSAGVPGMGTTNELQMRHYRALASAGPMASTGFHGPDFLHNGLESQVSGQNVALGIFKLVATNHLSSGEGNISVKLQTFGSMLPQDCNFQGNALELVLEFWSSSEELMSISGTMTSQEADNNSNMDMEESGLEYSGSLTLTNMQYLLESSNRLKIQVKDGVSQPPIINHSKPQDMMEEEITTSQAPAGRDNVLAIPLSQLLYPASSTVGHNQNEELSQGEIRPVDSAMDTAPGPPHIHHIVFEDKTLPVIAREEDGPVGVKPRGNKRAQRPKPLSHLQMQRSTDGRGRVPASCDGHVSFGMTLRSRPAAPIAPPTMEVCIASISPRVLLLDNFLSEDLCHAVIQLSDPRLIRSRVSTGSETLSRTSRGTFFTGDSARHTILMNVEQKIAEVMSMANIVGEGRPGAIQSLYRPTEALQVVCYQKSEFYAEHYDNKAGGVVSRAVTIIIYLTDVQVNQVQHQPTW